MADKPLNEKQLRTLLNTNWDDMQKVFPGHTRRFLEAERKRAQQLYPTDLRMQIDTERVNSRAQVREYERLYKAALGEVEKLRETIGAMQNFPVAEAKDMRIGSKGDKREATALVCASDWHMEERVTLESTNGLNEHNLEIADKRARFFFKNAAKLVDKEAKHVTVKNLLLWIGGDMLTGNIHADLAENNLLGPMQATALVQDTVVGGIRQLLEDLPGITITVVFSSGNHSRTTKEQRWATEHANSLEWLMAHSIASFFKGNDRVRFVRDMALLTYVEVHGHVIRFTHGHAIGYSGGVGGITIPILKAIMNWDRGRQAYMTVMGHFHQLLFHQNFMVNGSALGHSAYSVAIKAAPERPQQAFALIDAKYGVTMRAPILLEAA